MRQSQIQVSSSTHKYRTIVRVLFKLMKLCGRGQVETRVRSRHLEMLANARLPATLQASTLCYMPLVTMPLVTGRRRRVPFVTADLGFRLAATLQLRANVIKATRAFLDKRDFVEVETPVLCKS